MVDFLHSLCEVQSFHTPEGELTSVDACSSGDGLVEALLRGVPADTLFLSAVEERIVPLRASPLAFWGAYVENGQTLDHETIGVLRRNARRVVESRMDTNGTRRP
jgi:hypothetical protein